ncbi:MAG: MptD family putative ECF transporter S component [Treponema sp.]|jgi:hypothetical protein|nr:MptD family putative ECF transporter S component [Treponema sp.]
MNNKLKAKDLITTGIFTALFFLMILVFAMAFSAIPLMTAFIVCFDALVGGVIYLYLRLKVQRFGAVTIWRFYARAQQTAGSPRQTADFGFGQHIHPYLPRSAH